jgi:hypothetical protein
VIKEASQTRDYCAEKNATLRAARPDSLDKLGTGSSLRKERLFRMQSRLFLQTVDIGLTNGRRGWGMISVRSGVIEF